MRAVAAAALCALAGCVEDPALATGGQAIIGGTRTADGAFPAVGALLYDFGGPLQASCTGTLIAPAVVLTAAHCLDPEATGGPLPLAFTLVHDTVASIEPSTPITRVVKHAQYTDGGSGGDEYFDLGVAFLAAPIAGVEPLAMPTPDHTRDLVVGLPLALVGYGVTVDGGADAGVKFDAESRLTELRRTELRVSMGPPDPQTCRGDSGGPAIAMLDGTPRVVGVVSRGFGFSGCDTGSLDTRVDHYLRWIAEQVPEGIPCGSGRACYVEPDDGGCAAAGGRPGWPLLAAIGALAWRRRRRATCR